MLVNVDSSHLDWTCAVFLSQDPVGIQEIRDKLDIHTDNQRKFGLPSRLIAKKFLFRIIFGGTAFSFYKDPEFSEGKLSLDEWEKVIDRFYEKYKGVYDWHQRLIKEATTTKRLSIPTGREWRFTLVKNYKGELEWPITTIKNYVVQGLEADLMMLTRVSLYRRIKNVEGVHMINSVHDSVLIDCRDEKVDWVCETIASVFKDVPTNFERLWRVPFNLPYRGEIQVGKDWKDMVDFTKYQCG